MTALNAFIKPFEASQRSMKIKILIFILIQFSKMQRMERVDSMEAKAPFLWKWNVSIEMEHWFNPLNANPTK